MSLHLDLWESMVTAIFNCVESIKPIIIAARRRPYRTNHDTGEPYCFTAATQFPTGFKPAETFCQATQPQLEARPFVDANYG